MPDVLQYTTFNVFIEVPRGSFLKRGWSGKVDFVSPFPCPFNYGSIPEYIGGEGDFLDAVVLGSRLPRGKIVSVAARGAIGLTDRGMYDDKLICYDRPIHNWQKFLIVFFFHFYGLCKRLLNLYRGQSGPTYCNGWGNVTDAINRAQPLEGSAGHAPKISF
ncbi:MAG: inorganic diphosphatase [Deltaproteobacteria bacterium]|nr:inorganic diphosphatase [Deltaproteobacteria bacterium]